MKSLQPPGWPRPPGYSAGMTGTGTLVFVSGQIGWDAATATFQATDMAGQVRQALQNVVAVLAAAGAAPNHIARMTWYITSKHEYLQQRAAIGAAYRETIGRHYPAMSVVEVAALLEDAAKVEIEVTALVPAG